MSTAEQARNVEAELVDEIVGYTHDPAGFCEFAYPWGEGDLKDSTGLRVWQKEVLDGIGKHLQDPKTRHQPYCVAVSSGKGIGKAQPKSLVIDTPDGPRKWGELKPGDLVFGGDGKPVQIIACHEQGVKQIYRTSFDDGSSTLCCLDHLWRVRGRKERRTDTPNPSPKDYWRTLTVEEILEIGVTRSMGKVGAKNWEIPIQGAAEFEEREIDLHPYLVGVWIGDGTKKKAQYSKPYPEIADRIRGLGYQVITKEGDDTNKIQGVGHLFSDPLFQLGSHERYIPKDYKYNSVENRIELLLGLLDTDGEVHSSGSIGYSTTSQRLMDDVIWLVRSIGGKATQQEAVKHGWYPKDGKRVECKDCYRCTINLPFNPFTLKHRKERYKPSESRYIKRWIESIEYSHDEEAMCITVDALDGLYLTNDFIVTHNSCLISMIANWGMSTFEDCKIVITANTRDQLRTKTWPEVSKWFRLGINAYWWFMGATTIVINNRKNAQSWRMDMLAWSEENSQAFAGLHNKGKRIILIFDEASEIADVIWGQSEGILTDEGTEIIWIAFGNPTRNTGRFRECFGRLKHRWNTYQIDSRNVEGTNKEQIQQWLEDYGEDHDHFRIRVRGEFPRHGSFQLISSDSVAKCRKFKSLGHEELPKIMSVDVARFGDDQTVVGLRQGRKFEILGKWYKQDTAQTAERVIKFIQQHNPEIVVIDGDGLGAGTIDHMKIRGYGKNIIEFHGGKQAEEPNKYFNRRAEVWSLAGEALAAGMEIPDIPELEADLTGPEYTMSNKNQICLEKKDDMKARGLASPDLGDCFAMSFAARVMARTKPAPPAHRTSRSPGSWMG